jgi:hypothetical protein
MYRIFFAWFFIAAIGVQGKNLVRIFDRSAFYATMATSNVTDVNNELALLETLKADEKEAYEGALLMKKAGLLTKPAEKLKFFKSGRIKLETALLKDSSNGEYHFLRLIIQEHAPKIVKYRKNLEKDREFVINSFRYLPPDVQQAIKDYTKDSKTLHPEDF